MSLSVSFEVFPPKDDAGVTRLADTAVELASVDPLFVSVTYGAGGSARHHSFDAILATARSGAAVAAHLTCVGQPVHELESVVDRYVELGVRRIVALRGDPPEGIDAPYRPHPDGYRRTADLVAAARERGHFDEVIVAAYPERHPQSPSFEHDLCILADKVEAGAGRAITQMFFDNDLFARYLDRVRAHGIEIPIVPGVFPIHSFPAVARFASRCGATVPAALAARFEGLDDDPVATQRVAVAVAVDQIERLAAMGIEHVHLYTLNRPELVLEVCERLDLADARPAA